MKIRRAIPLRNQRLWITPNNYPGEVISIEGWRELVRDGNRLDAEVEAEKEKGTIHLELCSNCGGELICPNCERGWQSLAAMEKLEELLKDGMGNVKVFYESGKWFAQFRHESFTGSIEKSSEILSKALLALEEK